MFHAQPQSRYLRCEEREIHFMDWSANPQVSPQITVVAWHGLARTGRDMDALAEHLSAKGHRVICPDTIGRGLSQWSPKPEAEYCLAFYTRLAKSLLDQLQLQEVAWVGTSMGGAVGLHAASASLKGRIRALVLNDMGPEIAASAVERIRTYAGNPSAFDTVSELETYFRTVYKPYGWLSDAQWTMLTESSVRRLPDGRITPHYDPKMVMQFTHHPKDYDLWSAFEQVTVPMLCLRGEHSDLLLRETTAQMPKRNALAKVVEVPGCGHAPALNVPEHFSLIDDFLRG